MKELKKLTERELTRIRAIQQISHHIGYMANIILRKYSNNERYKGRNQLRLVLDNIDRRLEICELKLNHNGGAYSISIESAEINNLIATHTDILDLLLDLTNNRNYTFLRALLPEEHAIIIDNKPIITCIRSNRDTDKMYYKLKRDKTRYVYEDTKYDAVVCLDLKAAHVSDGFLLR